MKKKYSIDINKTDIDRYESNTKQFMQDFIKKNIAHEVKSNVDIYSLLLNSAVILEKSLLVKDLLKKIKELDSTEKMQILTSVDDTDHSPLSSVLESGNKDILLLFKKFIEDNFTDHKGNIKFNNNDVDKENILSAIEFSQFYDLSPRTCLDNFLKPIYTEESLKEIIGLVEHMEGN